MTVSARITEAEQITDLEHVTERVRRVVKEALGLTIPASEIPREEPLFGAGVGADSIASLEIVFGLEREFGIQVSDEELCAELFDSVASLVAYVMSRVAAAETESAAAEGARATTGRTSAVAEAPCAAADTACTAEVAAAGTGSTSTAAETATISAR